MRRPHAVGIFNRPRTKQAAVPTALRGKPVATAVRDDVAERVRALRDGGTVPTLGTVLASDAAGAARFMKLKHEACADLGIATRDRRLGGHASESAVVEAVDALSEDPEIDAVFVQTPLPIGVEHGAVGRRVDPAKDVDCFHPANLGRLVAGDPRFVPATTAAVCRLLAHYDVLVTAADEPGLVEGSMLTPGTVVVDVSANRRPSGPDPADRDAAAAGEDGAIDSTVVGDVDAESARRQATALTPVPGGVGPVTTAALVDDVVTATERRAGGPTGRPPGNGL